MSQQLSLREARTKRQKNNSYKHSRLKFRSTLKPSRSEHSPSDPEDEKNSQRKKMMKLDTEGEGSVDVTMGGEGGEKSDIVKKEEKDVDMPDVIKGIKNSKGSGGASTSMTTAGEAKHQEKTEEEKEAENIKEDEKDEEKEDEKDEEEDEDKDDDNAEEEDKEKDEENDEKKDETDGEPEEEKDKDDNDDDDKDSEDSENMKNLRSGEEETSCGKEEDDEDMPSGEKNDVSTDEADSKLSSQYNKIAVLPSLTKKKTKTFKRFNKTYGARNDFWDELSGDDSDDSFSYLKTKHDRPLKIDLFKKMKNVKVLRKSEGNKSETSTSTNNHNIENAGFKDISLSETKRDGDINNLGGGLFKRDDFEMKALNQWRENKFCDSNDETSDDETNDDGITDDETTDDEDSDDDSDLEETDIEKNMDQDYIAKKNGDKAPKPFVGNEVAMVQGEGFKYFQELGIGASGASTSNEIDINMDHDDITGEFGNRAKNNDTQADDTEADNGPKPFMEMELVKAQCEGSNYAQGDGMGASGASTSSDAVNEDHKLTVSDIEHALDPYDVDYDIDDDPSNEEDYYEFLSEDGASGSDLSLFEDDDFFNDVEVIRGAG